MVKIKKKKLLKEHLQRGAANPQIAYDKEFAKTSISTVESYRGELSQIRSQIRQNFASIEVLLLKSVGFASITNR
jgi:hypothetical protein